MSSKAHNVANLISSLGGPALNLGNIAWANDLEAGNLLLSWLADQLCESTVSHERGMVEAQETGEECERRARAAIGEVALEPEEVLMFVHRQHSHSHCQQQCPYFFAGYKTFKAYLRIYTQLHRSICLHHD